MKNMSKNWYTSLTLYPSQGKDDEFDRVDTFEIIFNYNSRS
jgi:hypothetical protein